MKRIFVVLMALVFASSAYAKGTDEADKSFHADGRGQSGNMAFTDKSQDTELQALIAQYAGKFEVRTYSDDVTGLSIQYNIYLPESYSKDKKYPAVIFIGDASCAGKSPEFSIKQGYGGLVWFGYDAIVIVPVYSGVILDDHNGFITSDYVELTGRFITWAKEHYGISRTYGTGQSMGCMTTLILASRYPELYTACLFVSGQWDITELAGLIGQKFIYAASAGDPKASAGQREVIDMFSTKGIPYVSYQNIDAKNPVISVSPEQQTNFLTFRAGTTLPDGAKAGASEHMTSFDYVYKIQAIRDWLFSQED